MIAGTARQLAESLVPPGVRQRRRASHLARPDVAPDQPFCYNDAAYLVFSAEREPMVKFTNTLPAVAVMAAALGLASVQPTWAAQSTHGDNLLIHRVQQEKGMNLPARGMTMAQVERNYGAPVRKLSPRGGDTKKHPQINRWDYSKFIVYFEHSHVIHSVLNTPAGNNTNPAAVN
jgi:hypothetical protein